MPKNLKQIAQRAEAIKEEIKGIADVCQRENRLRNEDENNKYETLTRELQGLQAEASMNAAEILVNTDEKQMREANKVLRENIASGRQTKLVLTREALTMTTDVAKGGIVPVKVQDIVRPLSEGLIMNKVGLPFETGLAGDFIWPTYEAVDATVSGEGVALADTKVTMGKLTAAPKRIGIAFPVTREAINQTEGIIEMVVKELIPLSLSRLINKIMLGVDAVSGLQGPFVAKKSGAKAFAGNVPTFKELLAMKAEVLGAGVDGANMCFVMTQAMKCELEGTPKDAGSGLMICENDRIAGIPVFCSHYIGEGYIGLGDWRYQPAGLFGEISFIVDPYSQARKNAVDFVLNVDFGTTTIQPKAFVLHKGKSIV